MEAARRARDLRGTRPTKRRFFSLSKKRVDLWADSVASPRDVDHATSVALAKMRHDGMATAAKQKYNRAEWYSPRDENIATSVALAICDTTAIISTAGQKYNRTEWLSPKAENMPRVSRWQIRDTTAYLRRKGYMWVVSWVVSWVDLWVDSLGCNVGG